MDKEARLKLFFERLKAAPPPSSHDEAFELVRKILNEIEDEHSGVPNNPSNWKTDGRLYPPQKDAIRKEQNFPGVFRYRSAKHNTYISSNGAIEVRTVGSAESLFAMPGADGKEVWSE